MQLRYSATRDVIITDSNASYNLYYLYLTIDWKTPNTADVPIPFFADTDADYCLSLFAIPMSILNFVRMPMPIPMPISAS